MIHSDNMLGENGTIEPELAKSLNNFVNLFSGRDTLHNEGNERTFALNRKMRLTSGKKLSLYKRISNAERSIDISADVASVLPDSYRLLRLDDRDGLRNGYEIALLNDLESSLAFYIQVTLKAGMATQIAWRSPSSQHAAVIADIADKVFFDYLLKRHDIVLSNDQITGEGQHRWQRQLSHALMRGMKIYLCQTGGQLKYIENQAALNELVDGAWSNSEHQSSTAALICKVGLTGKQEHWEGRYGEVHMKETNSELTQSQQSVGLRAAIRILEAWNATDGQIEAILRLSSTTRQAHSSTDVCLDLDQQQRVSLVLNIHALLRTVFKNQENVQGFPNFKNGNDYFGGRSPLEVMAQGDLISLYETYKQIEHLQWTR